MSVSLFQWHINLCRLLNAKPILLENSSVFLTHSRKDKEVHTFPKGICPKVNVIARLEFEFTYYDSAVHRVNHYTTSTPPVELWYEIKKWCGKKNKQNTGEMTPAWVTRERCKKMAIDRSLWIGHHLNLSTSYEHAQNMTASFREDTSIDQIIKFKTLLFFSSIFWKRSTKWKQ